MPSSNNLPDVSKIRPLIWALLLLSPLNGLTEPKRTFNVDDLYQVARASELTVSPDGKRAAYTVKTFDMGKNKSKSSLWLVELNTKKTRQLTNSTGSDGAPRWLSPQEIAFLSTRSGSSQIWSISTDGGEASQLTQLPVPITNFAVTADGTHAAIVASVFPHCRDMLCNKKAYEAQKKQPVQAKIYTSLLYRIWDTWRDETRQHVLWISLKGGEPRDLTPGSWQTPPLDLGGQMDLSISPDSKEVAFTANTTQNNAWNTNNDIFIVPTGVAGGEPRVITKSNQACDSEPKYSPNGKFVAYLAMKRPGYEADRRVLIIYNRQTGKSFPVTDDLDRSVYQFSWSPDSKDILFNANDRGHLPIYRVSVPSGLTSKLVGKHTNQYPQYYDHGTRIVYLQETVSSPAEITSSSNVGSDTKQISYLNTILLENIELNQAEEFEFQGAGGDTVHGFLIKPPGFKPQKKYPLLMLIHGGPQGSFGDSFHPRWNMQMFTTPGFVVAAVNFHGSTGYGQAFTDAVTKDWGGKPYEDIMLAVEHLATTFNYIDKDNVSAAGASYGGFMVNWILGHTTRFRSLVSHSGVYDLNSMYGATEELWFPEWEFGGPPWAEREMFAKFSPSHYADKFKTPTLVIHGEHDYRVPYTQGLQLFTALQRQGVESKLLFFPDETHFVQKPQNARLWWNTVLQWLADHAEINWTPKAGPSDQPTKEKKKKIAG